MILKTQPEVYFLQANTAQNKLKRVFDAAKFYFNKEMRVLVLVPNDDAAKFVDDIFWKQNPEDFLPHAVCHGTTGERIAITTKAENINQATVLINLCPHAPAFVSAFATIIELHDKTHPQKEQQSLLRIAHYQGQGCKVIKR